MLLIGFAVLTGLLLDGPSGVARTHAAGPAPATALQRGVSLGLFSEDDGFSYRPLLDEIAGLGADHVELVVAWYLDDVTSTELHEHPRFTAPLPSVARAIREAHAAGLAVFLFPIVRLETQHDPNEWRGTLRPRDRDAFFRSYQRSLVRLATLAAREHVELFSVGSELSTLDGAEQHGAWAKVVRAVRQVFHGRLTYSGNWDHYEEVGIYDLLDLAGLCGYFAIGRGPGASVDELTAAWRAKRAELERFSSRIGRPLVLTEVGYLSQRGAAAWPWNEGAREPVDLEDQRRCYEAFRRAWWPSALAGVYFWNWYGWGGAHSGGYTPRGKPAAHEIERLFREARR